MFQERIYSRCVREGNRAFGRAKRIVSSLSCAICHLVSPSSPSFKALLIGKAQKMDKNLTTLASNAAMRVLFGSRNIRVIIQFLIRSSCKQKYCKVLMKNEATPCDGASKEMALRNSIMYLVQFASLRIVFSKLKEGNDGPKHTYTFRVYAKK